MYTHKFRVIAIWLVVLAIGVAAALTFYKPPISAISIPGTEAQKTLDRYGELFPSNGKGSARIVFGAGGEKNIADFQPQIESLVASVAGEDGVSSAVSPFQNPAGISEDGTIAYAALSLESGSGSADEALIASVESLVEDTRTDGLVVEINGDLINQAPGEILGVGEIGGVLVALIVLVMTLGSLVAAGMPILIALVAVGGSMAGLFGLSQVIDVNATTPALAVMLGLAVGIDYSLFIVSRFKTLLLEGNSYVKAAGRAIATAGNAVIFAAATVVIALASLSIVQIPFMTNMGVAAAATVALAAIVSITLLPALMGLVGTKLFGRKTRTQIAQAQKKGPHHDEHVSHKTFWYKWGQAIVNNPIKALVGSVIVIAVMAIPVFSISLGLPTDQYAAKDTTQRKAYDLISQGFGEGSNGSLLVVVEGLPEVSDGDREAVRGAIEQQYATQLQETEFFGGEAQAQLAATIDSQVEQFAKFYQLNLVAERIGTQPNVALVQPASVVDNGTAGAIQVIPETAPSDDATIELIQSLRSDDVQRDVTGNNGATLGVTGSTALQLDIDQKLAAALPLYLGVVVGLSLILLLIAFRSVLIPIKATLGFLLSVLAMFGGLVAIYQWGWLGIAEAPGPIISFIPIIAIGILFGLAMDYEFFLVSSMHEAHQHTKDAKKAIRRGFSNGSKVVTAAGIIMISVFAGFIFNHDATIQAIGFGLALGILVDAFLVRMTIVPAVMTLFGDKMWWLPKWLDRRLPHISIEGESQPKV